MKTWTSCAALLLLCLGAHAQNKENGSKRPLVVSEVQLGSEREKTNENVDKLCCVVTAVPWRARPEQGEEPRRPHAGSGGIEGRAQTDWPLFTSHQEWRV